MAKYTPLPVEIRSGKKNTSLKGRALWAVSLVFIALIVGFLYRNDFQKLATGRAQSSKEKEAESIVKKVAAHIVLPQGELPTIATVQNASRFKDKAFFSQTKNGDKLLVYSRAQKIIIYRPSEDKVVDVGFYNPKDTREKNTSGEVAGERSTTGTPSPTGIPTRAPTSTPSPTP